MINKLFVNIPLEILKIILSYSCNCYNCGLVISETKRSILLRYKKNKYLCHKCFIIYFKLI